MDNRTQRQKRAQSERQRALKFQRTVRAAAIVLAIVLALISLGQSCSTRKAIEDLAAQIRAKKLAQAQEELLALQPSPSPEATPAPASEGVQITLSFVGDVAMGTDDAIIERGEGGDLFAQFYDNYGEDYFFENVKSIFEGDDLTTTSLYGSVTLTENPDDRWNWGLAFRLNPYYLDVFPASGIETINVGNSHWYDFKQEGYVDTLANLDNAGLGRFGNDIVCIKEVMGHAPPGGSMSQVQKDLIKVGYVGVWDDADVDFQTTASNDIAALKAEGCDIIIVEITWDSKDRDVPDDKSILAAHTFIDEGADLILGVYPGVVQGMELYHDKYIVYSVGSFMSSDPEHVREDGFLFQQTFTLIDGKVQPKADYQIIPIMTTAGAAKNDLCPVLAQGDDASRILSRIQSCSNVLDGGIDIETGELVESTAPAAAPAVAPPAAEPGEEAASEAGEETVPASEETGEATEETPEDESAAA